MQLSPQLDNCLSISGRGEVHEEMAGPIACLPCQPLFLTKARVTLILLLGDLLPFFLLNAMMHKFSYVFKKENWQPKQQDTTEYRGNYKVIPPQK
jgi:hypothetical protein